MLDVQAREAPQAHGALSRDNRVPLERTRRPIESDEDLIGREGTARWLLAADTNQE
jgi:hypothetical protein